MISIVLGNTPSAIAPWNGNKALFGTNPLALVRQLKMAIIS